MKKLEITNIKFLQVSTSIYKIEDVKEFWWALIYDYPESSKDNPHNVAADSYERASYLVDDAYEEYKDKEIKLNDTTIVLINIITKERLEKIFSTEKGREEYVLKYRNLSFEAQRIIIEIDKKIELGSISASINKLK